ncbi:hypothetical protein [Streptacidiphilus rugosus]|uniref:hypothetical protein n=1 Tax=Streptacidiphilus rugosus TaxID=405783 RepID=UPI00068A97B9|nr:hypothetical protein [Streptacidiphilus rugosus]
MIRIRRGADTAARTTARTAVPTEVRPRARTAARALRIGLVGAVLAAVAAGVVTSGPSGGAGSASVSLPASGPSVRVDPVTGQPVPLDPGGAASGSAGGVTGGGADAAGPLTTVGSSDARLPGKPTLVSPAASGSAVTVHGTGPFAGLSLTVAQTTDLVDQVVKVSWTGGKPTLPNPSSFAQDYLELMQCWGDAATGPDRTQCQYGADRGDSRGGAWVPSRQLNYGANLVDQREPIKQTKPNVNVYVPFHAVNGVTEDGSVSQFFDLGSTNEVPYAPTRADGTGQVYFETETGMEAPGLGCGQTPDNLKVPPKEGRRCWLVAVPRGELDVDDKPPTSNSGQLQSSPLSTSNWRYRMVVPLHFAPLGLNCPIGSAERLTYGTEMVQEAVTRWQPVLCQKTGSIFGYTKIDDDLARGKLVNDADPGLVYVADPVPADQLPAGRTPVYAPVALSGVAIAFDVQSQSYASAPPEVRKREGQRIPKINLTPRLVAKLLTQSYRYAVGYGAADVQNNALDLTTDPDFLALNPDFTPLAFTSRIADMLVPLGQSDAARHLWAWVAADPDAKAFLSGAKDPWGMTVNPNYTAGTLNLPRDDFPKSDPYCQTFPNDPNNRPPWCTLDAHPYANDMHDAARSAARGDTLSRSIWDATATPPQLKKAPPQPQGQIGILSVTDTATAARYGLDTADLRNGAGQFVAPTAAAMQAAESAMTPVGATGVRLLPPADKTAGAYPLTMVSYAATVPSLLSATERGAFAGLLRYSAGQGQTPGVQAGQLGDGYVPLPQTLRAQALTAAQAIATGAGGRGAAGGTGATAGAGGSHGTGGATGSAGSGISGGAAGGGIGGSSGDTSGGTSGGSAGGSGASPGTKVVTLAPSSPAVQNAARTARTSVGAFQYLLLVLLLVGLLAAATGPALSRYLPERRR